MIARKKDFRREGMTFKEFRRTIYLSSTENGGHFKKQILLLGEEFWDKEKKSPVKGWIKNAWLKGINKKKLEKFYELRSTFVI